MGFKVDASFLRFLTMGAVGVRSAMTDLQAKGFRPVELERYCTSNKIWATKVKRLRLPDLLCVRTGLRVEVRAKSDLKVRMSDAPKNPDRHWDVGLRDADVVAFVACDGGGGEVEALGPPVYFLVRDLRATVRYTKLGPPKSASEGAECDREWKCTVPSQDGEVLDVTREKIATKLSSGRRQTYRLDGEPRRRSYVRAGDRFLGRASIIAGVVKRLAPLDAAGGGSWDPLAALKAADAVDRYAAAKSVPLRDVPLDSVRRVLLDGMANDGDERVALEMAATAARIGMDEGLEQVEATAWGHDRDDLRMEAVLILTELGSGAAASGLKRIAASQDLAGQELRQAAAWGLGKLGCRAYRELVDLIGDGDDEVAMHAVAAFGTDAPEDVVLSLVGELQSGDARTRAAASKALQVIGSESVLRGLVAAARSRGGERRWVLATLGGLDPAAVRSALAGDELLDEIEPLLMLSPSENWLSTAERAEDLRFLLKQSL